MDGSAGARESVWMRTGQVPHFPKLQQNTHVDVCVIGAGIAGLTAAYLLSNAGLRVAVIEDGDIGSGETGRTTAHLSNALDDRFYELERLHGQRGARLAAESHTRAIQQIEEIAGDEQIDCEFQRLDGYLFLSPGDDKDILEREMEAARRAGLTDVGMVARAPMSTFNTGPCLMFPRQGQFHPLKYLAGIAAATRSKGGEIFTQTHAQEVESGHPALVRTSDGYEVRAGALIVATNTPVNDRFKIHTKQAAYRSYAVGMAVPTGSVTRALYWDTSDPYHYVRLQAEGEFGEVLIVGGEDHKTGQAEDTEGRFARLVDWARDRFPVEGEPVYRWSGQVMEPVDCLAFIGRNPGDEPNVYVVTGDSGHGMTHGTIAGMLLRDLIQGKENPWAALYDPGRITLRAAMDFTKENVNVAAQYADFVTPGEIEDAAQLEPDSGALMRRGLKKIAVYRDRGGSVHELSAVCPHLGCIVAWNPSEKTWDCPCHGSRFSAIGEVINGPAISGLEAAGDQK